MKPHSTDVGSGDRIWLFLGTNYTVTTLTGDVEGADTDAKVYITLYGEKGDSGFRKLDTTHFSRGKWVRILWHRVKKTIHLNRQRLHFFFLRNDTNTLVLPDLGKLRQVRILHDNSGSTPSWFLQKVRKPLRCFNIYSIALSLNLIQYCWF